MKLEINGNSICVVRGSLLDQNVEAIVNAANTDMRGGGGIDGMIHKAGGPEIMANLIEHAPYGAPTAAVVETDSGNLSFSSIFHVAGPRWTGNNSQKETEELALCYRNSLEYAKYFNYLSLGFCSISTGIYGFPLDKASSVALRTMVKWCEQNPDSLEIVVALYGEEEYNVWMQSAERIYEEVFALANK